MWGQSTGILLRSRSATRDRFHVETTILYRRFWQLNFDRSHCLIRNQ
jgi:hypothetical protein